MVSIAIFVCMALYGIYDTKKAIWMLLFLIMAIPLGEITPQINTILLLRIGSISVFEALILLFLLLVVIRYPVKIRNYLVLPGVLFIIYLFNIFVSVSKYGLGSTLADAKDYLIAVIMLILVLQITDRYSLSDFCNWVLKAVFVANIIVMIGYVLTFHTLFPSLHRFGFAIQALNIFTIPYIIYSMIFLKKYRRWMIIELVFQIYMMLISQNRANPIIILVILVFMLAYYFLLDRGITKQIRQRILYFVIVFVFFLVVSISIVYSNQNVTTGFLGRINEMVEGNFSTDSTKMRNINLAYYIEEIFEHPLGLGLGAYMPAVSIFTSGFDEMTLLNYGFDNAYITISYKAGILTAAIYLLFLFQHVFWSYAQRKNNLVYFLSMLILIGIGISGSFLTIQLAKNLSVYGFYMSFIIFLREEQKRGGLNEN